MARPGKCDGCDQAGRICANCGFCPECANESIDEGEGFCPTCVGDVIELLRRDRNEATAEIRRLDAVIEQSQMAYAELAAAVWVCSADELDEDEREHDETVLEAAMGAQALVDCQSK